MMGNRPIEYLMARLSEGYVPLLHLLRTKMTYGFPTYQVRTYCGETLTISRIPFWHSTRDEVTWTIQEFLKNEPELRCLPCQMEVMTSLEG